MDSALPLARNTPQWHLLGTGSLGCLFAAYLQRAGVELTAIVRDNVALQALHNNGGITLARAEERMTVAINAVTPQQLHGPVKQLLMCTKAQQTLAAITAIKSQLAPDAIIVLLQNGMGVRELLQNELPNATILHALSTEGAFRTERFHVTHAGFGDTVIGSIYLDKHDTTRSIVQSLQCERPISFTSDIEQRLWLKLAVNSVINPMTAIHRCRNGELLQHKNFDITLTQLCEELAQVVCAEHIDLNSLQMRDEVYRVIQMTAHNKSSMLQDIEAGRSSEVDFINGFIVRRALMHTLQCPLHAQLLHAVHALQPCTTN